MYLKIKAAVTLRTLGYLNNATIVKRLPTKPSMANANATTVVNIVNDFGNLKIQRRRKCK